MNATPISNEAIRASIVDAAKRELPMGSTVTLTGAGRRDDNVIAAQVSYRFISGDGSTRLHWATLILDRMQVLSIFTAATEAAADVDFMQAALN